MAVHIKSRRGTAATFTDPDPLPIIALVVDAIFPYHVGGREVRYHELTRRLADCASVHVYTMNWWRGGRVMYDQSITYHAISKLYPMYRHGRRSIRQALYFSIGCLKLLRARFDVLEADHIPYFQIPVLRLIASIKRTPFVVTWHEVWGRDYWREYLGAKGSVAWLVEWMSMRMPDQIIAASPQTAERLRSVLGSKTAITVAPNGVDLDLTRETPPDPSRTDLVVVGRLIDHKRVWMLLDAMAMLHAQGVPVTGRVIGEGPEREALQRKAETLGLGEALDFRHDVREQKEVYALLKAARVAVFPSDREGFGAAALEALACGVPVVTTSSPDNLAQYLVARSCRGHVCEPSVDALAATLASLVSAETRPSDLVDTWLADYNWDTVAEQVACALGVRSHTTAGTT